MPKSLKSQKTPPQRILVVISTLHKGGAERVVSRLSHGWIQQGHAVSLALFDVRNPAYPLPPQVKIIDLRCAYQPSPYMLVKLVTKGWFTLASAIGLARHLRQHRHNYDHMIGFMEEASIALILAGCLTNSLKRITVSVRLTPSHMVWVYRWLLLPLLYRLPQRIVVVSLAAIKQLEAMGIPRHKLAFIPNPVPAVPTDHAIGDTSQARADHAIGDTSQARADHAIGDTSQARADHAIGDTSQARVAPPPHPKLKNKYILAVGRLHHQKGFDLLLHAYAGLLSLAAKPAPDAVPDVSVPDLVILGEGRDRPALTRLAKSLGIADRVHLMGEVATPEAYYAHAEMFVLSSRYEGWPNVIMEAMAHGCPVISFACPTGPDEIITHGKNGFLVKNGDVPALARAMQKLLTDRKLRADLAVAGKARASEFTLAKIASRWLL